MAGLREGGNEPPGSLKASKLQGNRNCRHGFQCSGSQTDAIRDAGRIIVNEKRKIRIVDAFYVERYLFLQCNNFVISIEYSLPFILYVCAEFIFEKVCQVHDLYNNSGSFK
ncbi:hypothetical protein ANN_20409 [Periplaneta americana]|uniref:Uncharacterized protein n=1 Tax=Periplaneta americana TaxID=6978 RepID=A0ABQ8SCM9_PERAM|nr:hypothetical protein ANN_20409 [Periplaneta americana]